MSNDLLQPSKIGATPEEKVQNVRSLMQDLDLGLKSAAANFSLNSSTPNRGGPALGPVRPISAGSTYNPFIRPGYPMMNPMPNMQNNMMPGAMPGMSMTMQGSRPMAPMQGMRPMTMMPNSQPSYGMAQAPGTMPAFNMGQTQNSNLLQFNALGNSGFGNVQNNQQGQNTFDPFG